MRTRPLSALRLPLLVALSVGGCADIIGLEDYSSPGGGGKPGTCAPASVQACYAGAPGTENANACHAGVQVCTKDGTAWGPCIGAVEPASGASGCTCAPGEVIACYDGPLVTEGVGLCAAGKRDVQCAGDGVRPLRRSDLPRLPGLQRYHDRRELRRESGLQRQLSLGQPLLETPPAKRPGIATAPRDVSCRVFTGR